MGGMVSLVTPVLVDGGSAVLRPVVVLVQIALVLSPFRYGEVVSAARDGATKLAPMLVIGTLHIRPMPCCNGTGRRDVAV